MSSGSIEDFHVSGTHNVGGLAANVFSGNKQNITVKNGTVESTITTIGDYYTGGVFGYDGGYTIKISNIRVENVHVTGNKMTGGRMGPYYTDNLDGV